jgi:uncharacterized membrane protein
MMTATVSMAFAVAISSVASVIPTLIKPSVAQFGSYKLLDPTKATAMPSISKASSVYQGVNVRFKNPQKNETYLPGIIMLR